MPAKQFKPERAVYFNGLPKHVIREEVYKWACTLGWVRKMDLPDGYGDYHNKGYAYIHFKKEKDAKSIIAQERLHWKGHNISVSAYVETRSEEDRIPYKYRPGYISNDNLITPVVENNGGSYNESSESDSAIRSRASTSLSSTESWPSLKKAASIKKPIINFSKQNSTQTIVPVTSDCGSIESCTDDESFQQSSEQEVQFTERQDIPQTVMGNYQTSGQQMVAVDGVYLNVDDVSMMYSVLADEMQKLNNDSGSSLSITTNPDLVALFFTEVSRIIRGNEAVQTC